MSTFKVNAKNPTNPFTEFHSKVPPEGSIPRCVHSHYAPNGDAFHCEACHPIRPGTKVDLVAAHKFKMPHNYAYDPETVRANDCDNACPKCHSMFRFEIARGKNKCADCGEVYKCKNTRVESEVAA